MNGIHVVARLVAADAGMRLDVRTTSGDRIGEPRNINRAGAVILPRSSKRTPARPQAGRRSDKRGVGRGQAPSRTGASVS